MTRILRLISPILSIGLLSVGFFLYGMVWQAAVLVAFGVFWMVGLWARWDWISTLGLFGSFGFAAFGLFLEISMPIMFSSAIFALLAWDLAEFRDRLRSASPEDEITGLEHRHLSRLAWVTLVGAGSIAIALSLHLKASFEWIVILMLFVVWSLGRVVNRLLEQKE